EPGHAPHAAVGREAGPREVHLAPRPPQEVGELCVLLRHGSSLATPCPHRTPPGGPLRPTCHPRFGTLPAAWAEPHQTELSASGDAISWIPTADRSARRLAASAPRGVSTTIRRSEPCVVSTF